MIIRIPLMFPFLSIVRKSRFVAVAPSMETGELTVLLGREKGSKVPVAEGALVPNRIGVVVAWNDFLVSEIRHLESRRENGQKQSLAGV
jgi:hypothetical protein